MNDNDPTSVYIADVLGRAQKCATAIVDPGTAEHDRTAAMLSFICHVQTSVLLENLARHNQQLADDLVGWFGRIFEDGYAVELVHEWRKQITAGHLMHPIDPGEEDAVDANEDLIDQLRKIAVPVRIADVEAPALYKPHWLTSDVDAGPKRKTIACHCQIAEDHDGRGRTWPEMVPEAACGAVREETGIKCDKPAGHTDHHKGTSTDEHGEPMFSRWSNNKEAN